MNIALWTTGIACAVALSILLPASVCARRDSSIGTSPLVEDVAVPAFKIK
jgi:hypothetical protein